MSRIRSPNYPMFGLPMAIEKVAMIHKEEQHLAAEKVVIANALGYPSLHALAGRVISAVEKYGLLEEASGDKLKVSALAIAILHPASPEEKQRAINEAAFKPALFSSIKEEWHGERPSDASLRAYLIRNKFAADAVDRVIQIYRETVDLVTPDSVVYPGKEGAQGAPERQEKPDMQAAQRQQPQNRGAAMPYETAFTPASGEPFRVTFTGSGIDVGGRLTSPERADELIRAIEALKVLLKPAEQTKRSVWEDKVFNAGDAVPQTGTYDVDHLQHSGPKQIDLEHGAVFPECGQCTHGKVKYTFCD